MALRTEVFPLTELPDPFVGCPGGEADGRAQRGVRLCGVALQLGKQCPVRSV